MPYLSDGGGGCEVQSISVCPIACNLEQKHHRCYFHRLWSLVGGCCWRHVQSDTYVICHEAYSLRRH